MGVGLSDTSGHHQQMLLSEKRLALFISSITTLYSTLLYFTLLAQCDATPAYISASSLYVYKFILSSKVKAKCKVCTETDVLERGRGTFLTITLKYFWVSRYYPFSHFEKKTINVYLWKRILEKFPDFPQKHIFTLFGIKETFGFYITFYKNWFTASLITLLIRWFIYSQLKQLKNWNKK